MLQGTFFLTRYSCSYYNSMCKRIISQLLDYPILPVRSAFSPATQREDFLKVSTSKSFRISSTCFDSAQIPL